MDKKRLTEILLPTLSEAMQRVDKEDLKLVHYTRFEVAKLIIDGRSVWLRNARQMNDIGEIEYGIAATDHAFEVSQSLIKDALSRLNISLPDQFKFAWQHLRSNVVKEVYISCFSEHWPRENPYGRLSMWRAYGAPDGVALVLNVAPFRLETNVLNAYSSPVFYGEVADYVDRFQQVLINISENADELKASLDPTSILSSLAMCVLFGAVCLKHPGFQEEQEWRILHMPNIIQPNLLRRRVVEKTPPETVYEIPLQDHPDKGLVGLEPNDLVNRVIIGPTNRADYIAEELSRALERQGVIDPMARICKSGIPLRV